MPVRVGSSEGLGLIAWRLPFDCSAKLCQGLWQALNYLGLLRDPAVGRPIHEGDDLHAVAAATLLKGDDHALWSYGSNVEATHRQWLANHIRSIEWAPSVGYAARTRQAGAKNGR